MNPMDSYEYRIDDVTMANANYQKDDAKVQHGNSRSGRRGNHVY